MFGHPLDELLDSLAASPASTVLFLAALAAAALGAAGLLRGRRPHIVYLALLVVPILGLGAYGLARIPAGEPVQRASPPASAPTAAAGTVFIQVPDMDARFAADGVSKALRDAGFKSPGIEVVASGSPSRPEVRYFNPADRPVAERVASIAGAQGLSGAAVRPMATYKAPTGQVELWYPAE